MVAPLTAKGDDPRRDRRTQTEGGVLRGPLPGPRAREHHLGLRDHRQDGAVPSKAGRIARRVRAVKAGLRRARPAHASARVRLSQPARVLVRVRRRGRTVRVLRDACLKPGRKLLRVAWDARARRAASCGP